MAESSAPPRAVGHWLLAAMFALAGLWAARQAWRFWEAGGVSGRVVLLALALLGFVSLVVREVRAARRGAGGRAGRAPA